MKYYKKTKDTIERYDVSYDEKELEAINLDIIDKCGTREHKCYDTDYPCIRDMRFIRNLKSDSVGTKEYFEETRTVYRLDYTFIKQPELSKMIDDFIKSGDVKLLDYLFGDLVLGDDSISLLENEIIITKRCLDKAYKELKDYNSSEFRNRMYQFRKLLEDYEKAVDLKGINGDIHSQGDYKDKLRKVIILTLEDKIDNELYERVTSFGKDGGINKLNLVRGDKK